jgi:hypothetical protein
MAPCYIALESLLYSRAGSPQVSYLVNALSACERGGCGVGMDARDRTSAESALRALLLGASFVGAQWYGIAIAIVARSTAAPDGSPYAIAFSEVYLSIESRFGLFTERPRALPERAEDVPLHERVGTIARLAGDPVTSVTLGERHPHLLLTFESGRLLFLNGHDEQVECWTLQTVGLRRSSL